MKKIFIAYNYMMIGGSTTSLLSILNALDYSQYEVDLMLLNNDTYISELIHEIPKQVNLLPQGLPFETKAEEIKYKRTHLMTFLRMVYSRIAMKLEQKKFQPLQVRAQIVNRENARISRKVEKEYDVAIAFVETWATYYVGKYINAKKKIAWNHIDYIAAGFDPKYDQKIYSQFDKIVLVADECKTNFDKVFPEFAKKTCCVENLLSKSVLELRAKEYVPTEIDPDFRGTTAVTVCRIAFNHKGLDRVLLAIEHLCEDGLIDRNVPFLKWYIVGDGRDMDELERRIAESNLGNIVYPVGKKTNAIPYLARADVFLLPSRYEGKPMAVTEAMIMGIPAYVSNYASACEQVSDGFDGRIFENSDDGVYECIKSLVLCQSELSKMRKNMKGKDYSNMDKISEIIRLIEE